MLESLVQAGRLPEAVKKNEEVQALVEREPESLKEANVVVDLKVGRERLSKKIMLNFKSAKV